MTKNIDMIHAAVGLIIKAAILAARFSGRARKRSLKRLAKMNINDKDKEIIFLQDKVGQLTTQVAILQKGLQKNRQTKGIHSGKSCSFFATWKPFKFQGDE